MAKRKVKNLGKKDNKKTNVDQDLDNKPYRELQKLAKEFNIPANQAAEELKKAITKERRKAEKSKSKSKEKNNKKKISKSTSKTKNSKKTKKKNSKSDSKNLQKKLKNLEEETKKMKEDAEKKNKSVNNIEHEKLDTIIHGRAHKLETIKNVDEDTCNGNAEICEEKDCCQEVGFFRKILNFFKSL